MALTLASQATPLPLLKYIQLKKRGSSIQAISATTKRVVALARWFVIQGSMSTAPRALMIARSPKLS